MKYVYTAIIEKPEKDGQFYLVSFPDFDRQTQGKTFYEALVMAEDLLNLILVDYEDSKREIPKPGNQEALQEAIKGNNAELTYVTADTDHYRKKNGRKTVKKTLSIPAWLNTQAEAAGVNFSQTLQEALCEKLAL